MTTQNVIDTTNPWAINKGGTGSTTCKNTLFRTYGLIGQVVGTTIVPFDNTIPQITEGFAVASLAVTPLSASSILEIFATCSVNCAAVTQVFSFLSMRCHCKCNSYKFFFG
jgi:hypothetical protein